MAQVERELYAQAMSQQAQVQVTRAGTLRAGRVAMSENAESKKRGSDDYHRDDDYRSLNSGGPGMWHRLSLTVEMPLCIVCSSVAFACILCHLVTRSVDPRAEAS